VWFRTPGLCQSQLLSAAGGVDARFRGHGKALLGVVTPAKAGVHVLYTQPQDFGGTLFGPTLTVTLSMAAACDD